MVVLLVVMCSWTTNLFAQSSSQDPRWSRPTIDFTNSVIQNSTWQPAPQFHRQYIFRDHVADVSPNFRPHPTTNTSQSELSVDVHPTDENMVFSSANSSNWPVSTIYGTGVYWSFDGSSTWNGNDIPPFGVNGGDPASVIGPNGYMYEAYLTGGSYAIGMAVSTNNGSSWTNRIVNSTAGDDKEHMMVDKTAGSPYENNLYVTWTNFAGASEVVLRSSTDFGSIWAPMVNLSGSITPTGASFAQGANVQTGPNGEVYVTYCVYDANWTDGEDAIGFSKSTDGGATWVTTRAYDHVNFGIRGYLSSKGGMRVNSFPNMAVDRSGGPNDGTIYICWPQRSVAPAGNDPDVVMIKSIDGGTTWSAPFRVNDDPLNNGKDQIFPWCTIDQSTGQLLVVFYDSRNVTNNMAEVYLASSYDGGNSFNNFVVSDQSFAFGPISGFGDSYGGDYIGVAAVNDVAYPFWMDSRTGNSQGWMSKVTFAPPCPVGVASDPNPENGATDVDINLSQLSWTNGVDAVSNELYWGTDPGNLTLVQSGSLATSWNITGGPLQFFTTYYWKVSEIGDTCTSSFTFNFKTIQDPNFQIVSDTLYPQSAAYWTGSTDGITKSDGEVRTLYPELGWMAFDISSIPVEATITGISFSGYVNATNWPYWSITPMPDNPVTSGAATIYNDALAGYDQGTAYLYSDESSSFSPGWHDYTLENGVVPDLQAAVSGSQGWFAMGFVDRDFSTSYFVNFDGWNTAQPPYIVVDYNYITPVELSSFTAAAGIGTVNLNWSTATETNNKGFEIERKSTNGDFQKVGYVAGFGTTTEPKSYKFTDNIVEGGEYTYRLRQIDLNGSASYSNTVEVEVNAPRIFALEQNYPNPFNPATIIKYSIPQDQQVKLNVYNLLGENVMTLINRFQKAGPHEVNFNASNLASGVYFYKLEAGIQISIKKMILMK